MDSSRVQRVTQWMCAVAVLIISAGVGYYFARPASFSEAETIATGARDFGELSDRFGALAKEKGGVYAFEVLRRAVLPPGVDIHLLGHVIGDVLYTQEGIAGMAYCTPEFRNACSHTIVIGALTEFGEGILPQVHESCSKAPGGPGAYTMCFHGFGHGVFSYYDYDLAKTAAYCKQAGTAEYNYREYVECVGGAIMELVGGGTHDPEGITAAQKKYLSARDPLAPCDMSVIPDDAKGICYTYITPHLFEAAGADLAHPEEKHFKAAFGYCNRIPKERTEDRTACISGIGKEFPLLALDRDTRTINQASDVQLVRMRSYCGLAPDDAAYEICSNSIVDSLFWGGENDPRVAIHYCSSGEEEKRSACFGYLFQVARTYIAPAQRSDFCAMVPDEEKDICTSTLVS